MHGLIYTIHLLEPLLANSLGGDANSAQSLLFAPGALLRGALINAWLGQHNQSPIDAGNDELRRLFFDGRTRYLNAYPLVYGDERALPAPLAWHRTKNLRLREAPKKRDLFDVSVNPAAREEQLAGLGEDRFCTIKGVAAYWVECSEQLNVHTKRDAVLGRAREERGGAVFRYEALPAGYKLKGAIITASAEDAQTLKGLLNGRTFALGKSRTAGYGLVKAEVNGDLPADWSETGIQIVNYGTLPEAYVADADWGEESDYAEMIAPSVAPRQTSLAQFTLTLLSDAIVRDENGQHTLDPLPALKRRLDDMTTKYELEIDEDRSFRKTEIVGGFNRKWGLPLPQVTAIAAGSSFVINKVNPPVEITKLAQLQREGIGERRVDGFGRVAVAWYSEPPKLWVKDDEQDKQPGARAPTDEAEKLGATEEALAKLMLTRLLRRDLDRMLQDAVHNLKVTGEIPNSQLSRWRGVIFSALNESSPVRQVERLTVFLMREEEKGSAAWERMQRARMPGGDAEKRRLTEWIRDVLTGEGSPWGWLTKDQTRLKRSLGKLTVEPDLKLAVEYRLRLIDGVLARKAKPS